MSCSWMDGVGATRELWVVINYGSESAPTSRDKFSGSRRRFKLSSLLFTSTPHKERQRRKITSRGHWKRNCQARSEKMNLLLRWSLWWDSFPLKPGHCSQQMVALRMTSHWGIDQNLQVLPFHNNNNKNKRNITLSVTITQCTDT